MWIERPEPTTGRREPPTQYARRTYYGWLITGVQTRSAVFCSISNNVIHCDVFVKIHDGFIHMLFTLCGACKTGTEYSISNLPNPLDEKLGGKNRVFLMNTDRDDFISSVYCSGDTISFFTKGLSSI